MVETSRSRRTSLLRYLPVTQSGADNQPGRSKGPRNRASAANDTSFRFARVSDINGLLPLMHDFYLFERLPYQETRLRHLLTKLIEDENLGRLILFEDSIQVVGYMALGFGFSLEFHGRDCFIDEFYVKPERRQQGIGQAAVEFALQTCRDVGIKAVHLEADHFNERGHEFYKRFGFKDHDRHLMTRWL